jgi:hypothetical protein
MFCKEHFSGEGLAADSRLSMGASAELVTDDEALTWPEPV